MKTAVQSTSIEAYDAIKAEGRLTRQQARILDVIVHGRDYSLQEIVKATGIAINAVAGRANELRTLGVLELAPTRSCSVTGRNIHPIRRPQQLATQGALFS